MASTEFHNIDSPARLLKLGKEDKAKAILSLYIKPEYTKFMINSYKKIEDDEKEFLKKTKGKYCGFFLMIYNNYFNELIYAL